MRSAVHYIWPVLILTCAAEDSLISLLIRRTRQSECTRNEFTCSNGQCVGSYQVCDGAKDCHDGTDETQAVCSKVGLTCPPFAFRCAYGACVDKSSTCNGRQDCADNSDELLPECLTNIKKPARSSKCKKNEFACYSGQCINEFSVCDGVRDCRDGSDETITQCVNIRCPSFSFQCAYGACIDLEKKCNGVKDCSDGSDEDEELCEYSTNIVSGNVPEVRPTSRTTTTVKPSRRPATRPSGGCLLPEKAEGTSFKVEGCSSDDRSDKCLAIPGTWVPDLAVVTYSCDQGYALPQNNNIFCLNGTWRPQLLNCQKMCKPLFSESVDLVCSFGGQAVPCDLPARPGTKLRPKCKASYHIVDPSTAFKETECREDGLWDQPVFKCVADCGKPSYNSGKPLITFGTKTVTGEYPWHAGLYLRKNGAFTHSCGGTIINPHIIITAAHCVYDDVNGKVIDVDSIQVAVGKYTRSWEITDPNEQRIGVKEIIPQRAYRGRSNSYEQDIAAMDLVRSIVLSNVVLPACIDWTSEGTFHMGMIGTVVGWGLDENDKASEELKAAKLSYIDYDTCRRQAPDAFLRFITYDKFCAGASNGTSVQQGDSGGGITFVRLNGLHFLYGIVSIKPLNMNAFAAYTNVTDHMDWLQGVVNALKPRHAS
ncbi:Trypsin [Nesidiocoris tenuis]|uniref:Trypsin n=1 Tax=Nesidiocoris tenuis TaxID=355587 RepID=A0ABN7B3E7_9HEMI|nr:Trypsin [Nesidiocoris tenuis]